MSKILDTDSLPEQRWTSSTYCSKDTWQITALSWYSGMRKEKTHSIYSWFVNKLHTKSCFHTLQIRSLNQNHLY